MQQMIQVVKQTLGLILVFVSCLHIESVGITAMNEYMAMKMKNVKTYAYSPGFILFVIVEVFAHAIAQSVLQVVVARDGVNIGD